LIIIVASWPVAEKEQTNEIKTAEISFMGYQFDCTAGNAATARESISQATALRKCPLELYSPGLIES
jgi:hypothetical protein